MTAHTMKPLRRLMREEEPEWLVWVLVAAMLAIGFGVGAIVQGRTETFSQANLSLRYPAGWVSMAGEDAYQVLNVGQPFETTLFPANVSVRQMPVTEVSTSAQTPGDLALKWSNKQSQALLGYRVLDMEPATVRGKEAIAIDYVYVADPPMAGPSGVPIVARAVDVLVPQGETVVIASFTADAGAFADQTNIWQRILSSLEVK